MSEPSFVSTRELAEALAVEPAQRDAAWQSSFFEAANDAALAMTNPQVLLGPDGFPYFVLGLPPATVRYDATSVSQVTDYCLQHGFGVVLNPHRNPPDWVFTYGNLWAKRMWGEFVTKVEDPSSPEAGEERQVMVGTPNEDFLPTWARDAIWYFLLERVKLPEPRVILITDQASRPEHSLAFNVFREDCRDDQHFQQILSAIRWHLPGHYGLVAIPKSHELAERFLGVDRAALEAMIADPAQSKGE